MKSFLFAVSILFAVSCNNNSSSKTVAENKADTATEKKLFFPVTTYLKGQIYDIAEKGIFPTRYTTVKDHTDSVQVKFEQLNELMAEFLHPVIDSVNLMPFYTESRFLDQTINAYTFTYAAKPALPDSLTLQHWDVYIEPETGKVKRIYLVKKVSADKELQLTWQSNQWCKTTTIINHPDGTSTIEKEEKISWGAQ